MTDASREHRDAAAAGNREAEGRQGDAKSHENLTQENFSPENFTAPGQGPAEFAPPPADAAGAGEPDRASALEAECADLKDKLLRTLADMENLRRRTARDVADAKAYAVTAFARDMLNVADNINRALDSVPEEARAAMDGALKALVEGIELTERDLQKTLERHGVKKLEPQGQKFDPNLHQAMFEVPNAELPNGSVVQVVQEGYVIGERVLRPAMVGVSRGGPKAAAQGPTPEGP